MRRFREVTNEDDGRRQRRTLTLTRAVPSHCSTRSALRSDSRSAWSRTIGPSAFRSASRSRHRSNMSGSPGRGRRARIAGWASPGNCERNWSRPAYRLRDDVVVVGEGDERLRRSELCPWKSIGSAGPNRRSAVSARHTPGPPSGAAASEAGVGNLIVVLEEADERRMGQTHRAAAARAGAARWRTGPDRGSRAAPWTRTRARSPGNR